MPPHPFDLHVLGPPQTFALSQDQTLQFELALELLLDSVFPRARSVASCEAPCRVLGCFCLVPSACASGHGQGCESLPTPIPARVFSILSLACAGRVVESTVSCSAIQLSGSAAPAGFWAPAGIGLLVPPGFAVKQNLGFHSRALSRLERRWYAVRGLPSAGGAARATCPGARRRLLRQWTSAGPFSGKREQRHATEIHGRIWALSWE